MAANAVQMIAAEMITTDITEKVETIIVEAETTGVEIMEQTIIEAEEEIMKIAIGGIRHQMK